MPKTYILCSKCGAINKADNTNCIKCGAGISPYIVEADFLQPDFEEMVNNIPGNYLTEAGKITPDISTIFVEPEEEDVFVPEPDAFGLNGVLPKRTLSDVNQQSPEVPASSSTKVKLPVAILGIVTIAVSLILITVSIASLKATNKTDPADAVLSEVADIQAAGDFSDIPIDKLREAYILRENGTEISLTESKTYAIFQKILNGKYYIDVDVVFPESDNTNTRYAVNGEDFAILTESEDYTIYEYVVDSQYYWYNLVDKTAFTRKTGNDYKEKQYIRYPLSKLYLDFLDSGDDSVSFEDFTVKSYTVIIGGQTVTIETITNPDDFFGTNYYIFDANGNLRMCGESIGYYTFVNNFSTSIPPNIFKQPKGYNVIDQDEED